MLGKDPSLENLFSVLQRPLDPVPADLEITQAPKPVGIGLGASALGLHPGALQRQAERSGRHHQHKTAGRFGVAQARLFPPEAVGLVINEVFLDAEALPVFLEGPRAGGLVAGVHPGLPESLGFGQSQMVWPGLAAGEVDVVDEEGLSPAFGEQARALGISNAAERH